MEKKHVKIFPAGRDPAILARKLSFYSSIQRDVLFAQKVVSCYSSKTRHMLDENCPVATPTPEDSGMSFTEQSGTPPLNQNPVQPDPSAEIHPRGESPQNYSALSEGMDGEIPSREDSDLDSDSESDSEFCSDSDSRSESGSGSVVPSEESPIQPSEETSSENRKDHTIPEKTSPREPDSNAPLKDNQKV